tara:strand:- start:274 stop:528 length:255 start_codon:yes stop_codon:yes gene_type:complete
MAEVITATTKRQTTPAHSPSRPHFRKNGPLARLAQATRLTASNPRKETCAMDTLATPLTTMALLACAYGTHEKPKQEIKTVKKK